MIDTIKMKSDIVPIFLCLLLVTNILSGVFFLFDAQPFYDHSKYLQIPYVYADTTDNSSSSTAGSLTSSQTLGDNNGQGPPPGEGQGPPPGEGQGPPPGEGQGPPPGEPIPCQGGELVTPGGASCDPLNGGDGLSCDPIDPSCFERPPIPGTIENCFDGIDNNGNGVIDEGCPGGGPPPPTVPGVGAGGPPGAPLPLPENNPSPVDDRNSDDQFSGDIVPILGNGDRQTIFGAAFQTNLLPIPAAAELPREDICDDGQDNNHNGLRDSEDPSCSATKISSVGFGGPPSSIPDKGSGNMNKSNVLNQNGVTSVNLLIPQQSNTSVISISGEGKHDIRTISSFHRYSPEKLTIEKGSMVVWINQDPNEVHGINLIDKISGKTLFSYPVIRFGASAYYQFQEAGQFTYSDPMFPSMAGEITAVS